MGFLGCSSSYKMYIQIESICNFEKRAKRGTQCFIRHVHILHGLSDIYGNIAVFLYYFIMLLGKNVEDFSTFVTTCVYGILI